MNKISCTFYHTSFACSISRMNIRHSQQKMTMSSLKLVFYVFLLGFLNLAATKAEDPVYLYTNCTANKNFTANSAYQFNLNTLLSSLSSSAADTTEFYNTTAGRNTFDAVYGLFMCRGDVPHQLCHDCVVNATERIASECPYSKEAITWNDECLVRYSNRSFFSTVDERPRLGLLNTANTSNQENFSRVLANTLGEVVAEATKSGPAGTKNFATNQANFTKFETVYSLAQCTPDLSSQDCNMCLGDVLGDIPWCCLGKQGGRVLYPSCNLRFELYPFYRNSSAAQAPHPVSSLLPASPTPVGSGSATTGKGKGRGQSLTITMIVVPIVVLSMLFCFGCYFFQKRKKSSKVILRENFGSESTALESLQFDFATIEAATNKFSHENRIGKGGFGEVYKGILTDQREIAVKRLSRCSGQGVVQFKNEILLIAKLQHRNLVALLGFCLEEQEKILVYEYVPNNSLDYFLFGPHKRRILHWTERYKIIGGIARGILYLHEYSRLKVIHRDLKPSNILLDDNMNPKISDFGMARMVNIDETQGSTNRIVGTYGYMSPEYAMLGQFSEKSDVFSFGVMILEIISGKKNANSFESQHFDGLLSYAWQQWRDEKQLELLDPNLTEVCLHIEVIKCIQIGLLCVQENPDARPPMATIVSYLSNHSIQLPFPKEPAFFMHGRMEPKPTIEAMESGSGQCTNNSIPASINDVSMSSSFPR